MVHPQKRISVKKALEGTMGRLLKIKAWLVNADKSQYVNLDDILVDLKLTPDVLELPVPNYFIEDRKDELKQRDELMDTISMQHSLPPPYEEEEEELELDMGPPMSIDDAIQILQRNELGRQGRQRFRVMKQMAAQEEKDRKMAESGGGQEGEDDQHHAATACQRLVRGFLARRRTRRECVSRCCLRCLPKPNCRPRTGAKRSWSSSAWLPRHRARLRMTLFSAQRRRRSTARSSRRSTSEGSRKPKRTSRRACTTRKGPTCVRT